MSVSTEQILSRFGLKPLLRKHQAPKGFYLLYDGDTLKLQVLFKRDCPDEFRMNLTVSHFLSMSHCFDHAVNEVFKHFKFTPMEEFMVWNSRYDFCRFYGFSKKDFKKHFNNRKTAHRYYAMAYA